MRIILIAFFAIFLLGSHECEDFRPYTYQMLCLPGSSAGIPYTLPLGLCKIADKTDERWCCMDWEPYTIYCECVTTEQVEEWNAQIGY